MKQQIKDYLVSLGPKNPLVRAALRLHGRLNRSRVSFKKGAISLKRGKRELILSENDFYQVPISLECFEQIFDAIDARSNGAMDILDFSIPGMHRYKRHDISLSFPGIPEDDSIEAYTHWYKPQPGDLVFDVGAYAGFTTCMLARMVNPGGHVVAFEPDEGFLVHLERNLINQRIANVTVVKKAIDAKTGTSFFNSDGTMAAGLVEYSIYGNTGRHVAIETLSLEDAFSEFGAPQFVKMDIEGAEIKVIQSAANLLKRRNTHLAFDSYHRMHDGRYTWMLLEPILRSIGYEVSSSETFGQMFTWARPQGG